MCSPFRYVSYFRKAEELLGSMIGVDEAGKGAVLGSMFVTAIQLPGDGVAGFEGTYDSKQLSRDKREEIASELKKSTDYAVVEVSAEEIDMYVREGGMNDLVVRSHSRAIEELGLDDQVVADASDVDAERFESRLSRLSGMDVTAKHRADEEYSCVAAASIIAKVERDLHADQFSAGSGYPGDPHTQEYLQEYVRDNGSLPPFTRSSWTTSRNIMEEVNQSGLDEF